MANTTLVPKAILPSPPSSPFRFLPRVFNPTVNRSRALPPRRKEEEEEEKRRRHTPHSPSLSRIEVGHEWIHRCIRQWNRDHASGVRTRFCRPEHKYEKAVESKRPPPPSRYLEERFIGLVSFVSQRLRVLGDTRWLRRYSILEGRVYRASSMDRMCVWKWRGPLLRIPAAKITAALNFNGGDDKY